MSERDLGASETKAGLIFPQFKANYSKVALKDSSSFLLDSSSSFWSAFSRDFTGRGWAAKRLVMASNTSEQPIVELVSGQSGVLTQVITGSISSGTVTVTVIADDKTYVFTDNALHGGSRMLLGGIFPIQGQASDRSVSEASVLDNGYGTNSTYANCTYSTPAWAINRLVGIPFSNYLKVTVQHSVIPDTSGSRDNAACSYLVNRPVGV